MINKFTKSAVSMLILASTTFAAHAAVGFDTIKDAAPVDVAFNAPSNITVAFAQTEYDYLAGTAGPKAGTAVATGWAETKDGTSTLLAVRFNPAQKGTIDTSKTKAHIAGENNAANIYTVDLNTTANHSVDSDGWVKATAATKKLEFTIGAGGPQQDVKPDIYTVMIEGASYSV